MLLRLLQMLYHLLFDYQLAEQQLHATEEATSALLSHSFHQSCLVLLVLLLVLLQVLQLLHVDLLGKRALQHLRYLVNREELATQRDRTRSLLPNQ